MIYSKNSWKGFHLEFGAGGELRSLCGNDMIYTHFLSGGVWRERVCQSGSWWEKVSTGTVRWDRKQTLPQINTVILVVKVTVCTQVCVFVCMHAAFVWLVCESVYLCVAESLRAHLEKCHYPFIPSSSSKLSHFNLTIPIFICRVKVNISIYLCLRCHLWH